MGKVGVEGMGKGSGDNNRIGSIRLKKIIYKKMFKIHQNTITYIFLL